MPEEERRPPTKFDRFMDYYIRFINAPITIVKEKIADPLQNKNPPKYYHRRYRRIPGIDECDVGDQICFYEVNEQFRRDKKVEGEIINILQARRMECEFYYGVDHAKPCEKVKADHITAKTNYFVKYGDLAAKPDVLEAYMKQKHRMLWERRHGEVGTGMKKRPYED